jgi:hypothetical protein
MVRKITFLRRVLLGVLALFFVLPAVAEVIEFDDSWGQPGINLVRSDAGGVEIVFSVTEMELLDIDIEGEVMQGVVIPGVFLPNEAGAPNLPSTGRFIALPSNARAKVQILEKDTEIIQDINLAPAFEIPLRDNDLPLKYSKDPDIYGKDAYYPAQPIIVGEPGKMRGVDVVIIGVTPFQYNPVKNELLVYKNIRFRLNFTGGNGHFGEDRLRNRWWEPILKQNLLNYSSLNPVDFHSIRPQTDEDNVEYIIIVPDDPSFVAWADSVKRWRNEQGIITGITTLSEIGGNDATLIENYINNAYHNWDIPPVAVLLLSDYQDTGDLYGITSPFYQGQASDNTYADIDGDDLPELNIARITAQTPEHLQSMLGKMLSSEREPCTDPNFYNNPIVAAAWEPDRWFILNTEIIYGYFNRILGKLPVREYATFYSPPTTSWSSNVNTYMVVNYFGPSGYAYIPSTPAYLNDWGGNAQRINRDINQGAFMAQHCDHGNESGWSMPSYTIADLDGLATIPILTFFPIIVQPGDILGLIPALLRRCIA